MTITHTQTLTTYCHHLYKRGKWGIAKVGWTCYIGILNGAISIRNRMNKLSIERNVHRRAHEVVLIFNFHDFIFWSWEFLVRVVFLKWMCSILIKKRETLCNVFDVIYSVARLASSWNLKRRTLVLTDMANGSLLLFVNASLIYLYNQWETRVHTHTHTK